MKNLSSMLHTGARILMGAGFFINGLNGFFHFIPIPAMPEAAGTFMGALATTGYMFPLIKGFELAAGFALLTGRFVPLALLALAPIMVNILAFHAALAPAGLGLPIVLTALGLYVAWSYRDAFRPVLRARTLVAERAPSSAGRDLAVAH